jgi:hypothetical protein
MTSTIDESQSKGQHLQHIAWIKLGQRLHQAHEGRRPSEDSSFAAMELLSMSYRLVRLEQSHFSLDCRIWFLGVLIFATSQTLTL